MVMEIKTGEGRVSKEARLFSLGQIVCTQGALLALETAGQLASHFLVKHALGDWGDLCDEDKVANDEALADDLRILSAYRLEDGTRIWIITEADRSSSCVLLPSEY